MCLVGNFRQFIYDEGKQLIWFHIIMSYSMSCCGLLNTHACGKSDASFEEVKKIIFSFQYEMAVVVVNKTGNVRIT